MSDVLGSHNRKLLITTAAVSIGFVASGSLVFPHIVARHLRPNDQPAQYWESGGFPIKYAGPVVEVVPNTSISTPRTVRVSESKPLLIAIGGARVGHDSDMIPELNNSPISDEPAKIDNLMATEYTVTVIVGGDIGLACSEPKTKKFGVYPANLNTQTWYCTMHPKDAGDYTLYISGLPPKDVGGTYFTVTNEGDGKSQQSLRVEGSGEPTKTYVRSSDGTAILPIQVLTIEGLTASQSAWLKAIGAILGILGTILAFPFLKSMFPDAPPSTPPLGTSSSKESAVKAAIKGSKRPVVKAPRA
jgi:hypothetical protein